MAENKKYYWLKLKRDFFKRHDIRIVEEMPNGKDYILFYLKMLLESIDHDGELRFSETIPYNEQMLSVITNTNVDIVRAAMKIFVELGMVELYDDRTIYMSEVQLMIGSETKDAERKRRVRAAEKEAKMLPSGHCPNLSENCPPEIEIDIDKDIDIDIRDKTKRKRFVAPTVDEVRAYCKERNNNVDAQRFVDFYEAKGWMIGKNKMKSWERAVNLWERNNANGNGRKTYSEIQERDYKEDIVSKIPDPTLEFMNIVNGVD